MGSTTVAKNKQGYGYKYTDLSQIHEYLESIGMKYYQYIEAYEGNDYIYTVPIKVMEDGSEKEYPPRRGCRIIQATLSGKSNPAQENGSAITYARRYSLLMAFGLATEDDDAESLTRKPQAKQQTKPAPQSVQQPVQQPAPQQNDEILNQQMIESVDQDLVPHGEGMTPKRIARIRKAMAFTGKNEKTVLATAKANSFEEITEASYISVMNLFFRLMTDEQKKEIEAI